MPISKQLLVASAGYRVSPLYSEFGSGGVTGYQFEWRIDQQRWARPFSYDTQEEAWLAAHDHYLERFDVKQTTGFKKAIALVEKHICDNVSELVIELQHHEKYKDELHQICSQENYIEPAINAGYTVEKREDGYYLINKDGEDGSFIYASDAWEEACHLEELDPEIDEAYEFWSVSGLMMPQLIKRGEMVIEFFGLNIWGRCNTNSELITDDVIIDIANNTTI